jgi:hypothetical protein
MLSGAALQAERSISREVQPYQTDNRLLQSDEINVRPALCCLTMSTVRSFPFTIIP